MRPATHISLQGTAALRIDGEEWREGHGPRVD